MKKLIFFIVVNVFISTNLFGTGYWTKVFEKYDQFAIFFKSIRCKDSENCIAVSNRNDFPIFYMSSDGGFSWKEAYRDNKWSYYDSLGNYFFYKPSQCAEVSYLPSGKIVVVGDTGTVWRSNDNGTTWDTFKIRSRTNPKFMSDRYNISMYSDNFGAISCPFDLYITKDGWNSYQKVEFNLPDSIKPLVFLDVYCPDDGFIIALVWRGGIGGRGYYIIRSEDYGTNWEVYQPIYPIVEKFFFLDKNNGYAVAGQRVIDYIHKDLIFHTTDGGITWEKQLDTIEHYPDGLTRIYFYDKNHGVAIGNWHKMWRTSNGGKSWYKDSSFNSGITADYFSDIVMLGPNEMIGITEDGSIYKYSEKLSIDENKLKSHPEKITISPNPAFEYIEISGLNKGLQPLVNGSDIKIFNLLGECVINESINPMTSSHRMNIERLPAGLYFVRVGNWVGRFVKI
jgi:photosystem II stability/assembly factor-like uncharacterized protein